MKVLIATPAYSDVKVRYASSLAQLMNASARLRPSITLEPRFASGTVIHRLRNTLANLALSQGYSHLIFIDSDIGFQPSAVFRMVDSGHDVCGCLYPRREANDALFHRLSRQVDDPTRARRLSQAYVAEEELLPSQHQDGFELVNGFAQASSLGMGLTLISRDALIEIAEKCPDICLTGDNHYYAKYGFGDKVYRFFDPVQIAEGDAMDEDYSFCHRWRENCQGKLFALLDEELSHTGEVAFSGTALERMKAGGIRPR